MTATARYRCRSCATTFTAWAPAERHADAEHHHRVEVLLTDPTPNERTQP